MSTNNNTGMIFGKVVHMIALRFVDSFKSQQVNKGVSEWLNKCERTSDTF